ncbi:hypothetical protein F2Q69_00047647 [Brassica cretica]|uniref:Uncharacterized protein n=1 Tax=Brassica cretica TaxID=69181 RepID=A0A8S9PRW5_BRACR|nr:hypothetical protein F2Q69_00047647 [Brassica cretica]
MAATKNGMFFITWFSSFTHLKVFQIWKTSGLEDFQARRLPDDFQEVFQTTSGKSSDGIFSYISLS